jgi:hypothetical protein
LAVRHAPAFFACIVLQNVNFELLKIYELENKVYVKGMVSFLLDGRSGLNLRRLSGREVSCQKICWRGCAGH